MRDQNALRAIHRYSDHHRDTLARSSEAGCFHCQAFFHPREITEWVDEPRGDHGDFDDAVTALCPRCGIDAVLPSAAPIALDAELLAEMHQFWF